MSEDRDGTRAAPLATTSPGVRVGARRFTILFGALALAAACGRAGEPGGDSPVAAGTPAGAPGSPSAVEMASPYSVCYPHTAPPTCADSVEAALLDRSDGLASRGGDTLTIRGRDGSRVALLSGFPPDSPLHFRYAGYFAGIEQHGVELARYEGGGYILIDAVSTQQTHTLGPPVPSPARTRIATASLDLIAGHDPNGIQVWSREAGYLRLEWDIRGGSSWGAANPNWLSENEIEFDLHRPDPADAAGTLPRRVRLSIEEDGVRLGPNIP
jgi:hypothetical protein